MLISNNQLEINSILGATSSRLAEFKPLAVTMEKSLLFELISSLSPSERREAQAWLEADVHNRRPILNQLLSQLVESIYIGIEPDRDRLWAYLFPQQEYDDQQLRLLNSYLLRKLEYWLTIRHFQQDQYAYQTQLLNIYQTRGLNRHFDRRLREFQNRMDRYPFRDAAFYRHQYDLQQAAYRREASVDRNRPHNLQEQDDALLCHLMSERLRQACLSLAHRNVYETEYRLPLLSEILDLSSREPYVSAPAVLIYRNAYLAQIQPDSKEAFDDFRQAIFNFFSRFAAVEMRNILLMAINAGIRRINDGQTAYFREVLNLYRKGLSEKLLLEQGRISPFTYNNVVGIALRLEELDWAESFLHEYRNKLENKQRKPLFALNAARIEHARGNYQSALLHLQEADYRDFIHGMSARVLQLKIYFSLGETDALMAHLKNTRAYLNRRPHVGYHEQNYRNIINLTERLFKLNPLDKKAIRKLRDDILACNPLTEKDWLLGRLDQ